MSAPVTPRSGVLGLSVFVVWLQPTQCSMVNVQWPKRIALSVSIRVICVRCLIAAYPMVNGQWSMVNGPCSMFNDQNGCKGTLIKRLNQKIMLKNVRGGLMSRKIFTFATVLSIRRCYGKGFRVGLKSSFAFPQCGCLTNTFELIK